MFEFEHHTKILKILHSLNTDLFKEIGAYFGGGTLLALLYNEYRQSKDIDFVCPVGTGYRELRNKIDSKSYNIIFNKFDDIKLPREIKIDQYGVRFLVLVDETPIKFEIFAEARIQLENPTFYEWCPAPCLSFEDCCAEKLLANADRWNDTSIESRDLIDLAILRLQSELPKSAVQKAEQAYAVIEPLKKALNKFQSSPKYREKCFSALEIENREAVIDGIDLLASDLKLPPTSRIQAEDQD